jgi:hypothetical protein
MKTTILSSHTMIAGEVFKALHQHTQYKYLGEDQQGNLLIEVKYEKDKDSIMRQILKYVKEQEEIIREWAIMEQEREQLKKELNELNELVKGIRARRKARETFN